MYLLSAYYVPDILLNALYRLILTTSEDRYCYYPSKSCGLEKERNQGATLHIHLQDRNVYMHMCPYTQHMHRKRMEGQTPHFHDSISQWYNYQ